MDPNQFVIVSWKQQSDLCRFSFFFFKKKDKTDKTEPLVQLSGFQIFHLEAAFIWPKHLL